MSLMNLESQKVTSIMSLGGNQWEREEGAGREGGVSADQEFVSHSEYNRMSLEDCVEGEGGPGPGPGPCLQSLCWVRYRESGF